MRTVGLFDQDPPKLCTCHGCCGEEWEDFPDVLYLHVDGTGNLVFGVPDVNVYVVMHKQAKRTMLCDCGGYQDTFSYVSDLINYLDNGLSTDETCCVQFSLIFGCWDPSGDYEYDLEPGECFYAMGVDWSVGDGLTAIDDITPSPNNPTNPLSGRMTGCTTLEGFNSFAGTGQVPACLHGAGTVTTTVSRTNSFGVPLASPCPYDCCQDISDTLYATINSPACPKFHGVVVTLIRQSGLHWVGTFTPNGDGTECCNCGLWQITFNTATWGVDPPDTICTMEIRMERIDPPSDICFAKVEIEHSNVFCPPVTFSYAWGSTGSPTGCFECCDEDSSMSIEVTG